MPRKLPDLLVYANPWHGELDKHHRVNTACPWDPKDNPNRVFVGAQHRLDEEGEIYFEFSQFEGTHGVALAKLPKGADRKAAAQELIDSAPDNLVLRMGHEPVRLPNTVYFLQAIRCHAILAADLATHVTAFGREGGFLPIDKRVALLADGAFPAHKARTLEDADPKPRPAHGAGHLGESHAHRPLSAVVAAPPGTGTDKGPSFEAAAQAQLKATQDALAKEAAKKAASTTNLSDASKGQ